MKNVLLMCRSNPSTDPRPNRAIYLCNKLDLSVDVVCEGIINKHEVSAYYLLTKKPQNIVGKFTRFFYKLLIYLCPLEEIKNKANNIFYGVARLSKEIDKKDYALIIVEDIQLLSIAFNIKKNAKILFDAREFYPLQNSESLLFNIFEKPERKRLCRTYLNMCDKVITVSNGLKDKYMLDFGIECDLIRSVPNYHEVDEDVNTGDKLKLVYHGAANRNRKIETLIKVSSSLKNKVTLDLYLVGDHEYRRYLNMLSNQHENISVKEPMAYKDIIPTIKEYDIGMCFFEPTTFNLKHCLPNKLFEYIQARVPVLSGPSPDIMQILIEHKCGFVTKSFSNEDLYDTLNQITRKDVDERRENANIAAKELCFENEGNKLSLIIRDLVVNV